jgi:hypothetical protein
MIASGAKSGGFIVTYEARNRRGANYALAAATLALSLLGFVAIGVIPTRSTEVGGTYPLAGWLIVAACFGAAFVFIKRSMDRTVQARADENGIYSLGLGETVPWADITGVLLLHAGVQKILRFDRKDAATFGINTTYYDRGIGDLLATVRHYRPDLGA